MHASDKPGFYRPGDLVKLKPGFTYITMRRKDGTTLTIGKKDMQKLGHGIVVEEILSPGFDPPIGSPDAKLTNIASRARVYWQNGESYVCSKKWLLRVAEVHKVNKVV